MSFDLNFPSLDSDLEPLQLDAGQMLFVLGANGTGKSSLMYHFNRQNRGRTRKVSAHRQTWMNSDTLDMTPSIKVQTERQIQNEEQNQQSRYRDSYAAQRASMTIYELIDAENGRARDMAAAYDAGDMDELKERAKVDAPITVINELLKQSNLPIRISIRANERVMASKNDGAEYSAAELSDGERNALMIAASVLTAPPGTLLIIDEPERHLHRSIISPLLGQLFDRRQDCGFVISTHDDGLPFSNAEARTLLLRSCNFDQSSATCWEADLVPAGGSIDNQLRQDLLGARRSILFVEGTESSLDKPLYSVVFPMVSVIPKGNCREVEQAVLGARAAEELHWLSAFGVVDSDGFDSNQVAAKRAHGVYAVPYYSVEAIYFHPEVIGKIATRQASVVGGDSCLLAAKAITAGVEAIRHHTVRLSKNAAKRALRRSILDQIPNDDELLEGNNLRVVNKAPQIHGTRRSELDGAVEDHDWELILRMCPVRESTALEDIARVLGFGRRKLYEQAVRHLLVEDADSLDFVRALFDDLAERVLD